MSSIFAREHITWRDDPNAAFEEAIADGRLSRDPKADNFAGHFMYMGTRDGVDTFKNVNTRAYIK